MIRVYGSTITGNKSTNLTFDENALSFIDTAGIIQVNHQTAVNNLVKDLKKYGVWGKLTAVYPFVGGNANAHSYNLIDPAKYRFTWGSQAEHTLLGVVPRTQAHQNNLLVSDISSNAGNDVSIHLYVDGEREVKKVTGDINSTVGANNRCLHVYMNSVDKFFRFDCGLVPSNSLTVTNVNILGMLSFTSTNNKQTVYQNGIVIGEKANTTPTDIQSLKVCFNYDSATYDNHKQFRFLSWGNGLTSDEILLLNEAIQKFQTNLNRAIEVTETPDTDATAFIEASQIKEPVQKLAINYLTRSLKSSGLWDKFTTLYPLVGGTYGSCKYNLMDVNKHILSDSEGVVYSNKGILPTSNVEIGLFNDLFPSYNTNRESSFDLYIQEDKQSADYDFGFDGSTPGLRVSSSYTGREVYYLSSNVYPVQEDGRISKNVGVPTNGLFSCQSAPAKLAVYKNGIVLIDEAKSPSALPDETVNLNKNIRTFSLVATRKSNLTAAELITYNRIIDRYQKLLNRNVKYEPVMSLDFNELPISDRCGKTSVANHGVILEPGKLGMAGRFNNGYLMLDRTVYANLVASGTYTIEYWQKLDIKDQHAVVFGSCEWDISNAPGSVAILFDSLEFSASISQTLIHAPIKINEWQFVRIVVEHFVVSLYLNEQLKGTATLRGPLRPWPLYIGAHSDDNDGVQTGSNRLAGLIDEFRIYDVAKHP